jgi:hypothetical protein
MVIATDTATSSGQRPRLLAALGLLVLAALLWSGVAPYQAAEILRG